LRPTASVAEVYKEIKIANVEIYTVVEFDDLTASQRDDVAHAGYTEDTDGNELHLVAQDDFKAFYGREDAAGDVVAWDAGYTWESRNEYWEALEMLAKRYAADELPNAYIYMAAYRVSDARGFKRDVEALIEKYSK